MRRGRAELFTQAAETFATRARQFSSVLEVALTGSLAAGDPWPATWTWCWPFTTLRTLSPWRRQPVRSARPPTPGRSSSLDRVRTTWDGSVTAGIARRGRPGVKPSTAGGRRSSPTYPIFASTRSAFSAHRCGFSSSGARRASSSRGVFASVFGRGHQKPRWRLFVSAAPSAAGRFSSTSGSTSTFARWAFGLRVAARLAEAGSA